MSRVFPALCGTLTVSQIKEQIRHIMFRGLSDPVRKMRLACVSSSMIRFSTGPSSALLPVTQAAVISDIAHPDWPDDWPSLMSQLLQLIGPGASPDSVDGGMRVLNDFVGIDLTEDQLLPIAKDMLPHLMTILGSPQVRGNSQPDQSAS